MIVSMIQLVLEMPGVTSIKEKRRVVKSLKERLIRRFRVSAAEVDLHESLSFAQIGAAVVTNSRTHGESIMHKILAFVEDEALGRVQDVEIHTENYG